ncbi:MAG: zf-HC2 domain-containing protein [Cellulomonas sp.]|nr:zf-HC2 domain-containing protein [Cellulomonas sp.]
MAHLGPLISDLLDGRLDPADAERAFMHLAGCTRCAGELMDAREVRAALAEVAGLAPPQPTGDLTARLLSLRLDVPAIPRPPDPFLPVSERDRVARAYSDHRALRGELGVRHPARRAAVPLVGIGAFAAALFVLGSQPVVAPSAQPAVAFDLLADAAATRTVATTTGETDLSALRAAGWVLPETLPDGWQITSTGWASTGVLEVDVAGDGLSAVVTEQQGRLDPSVAASGTVQDVGGRQVVVLSQAPWVAVWQSGSTVVEVVAPSGDHGVAVLVAAFPAAPYDDGVTARLVRGWAQVAGTLTGS